VRVKVWLGFFQQAQAEQLQDQLCARGEHEQAHLQLLHLIPLI
jgi:hypothetical protein